MKQTLALLTCLLLATAGLADPPPLKLPDAVSGDPGDFITVKADTTGKTVKWLSLDKGLKVFPIELLKDTKTLVVVGSVPGQYRLLAYTAAGDEASAPAVCTVTINGPPAPPPPPVPPTPPAPVGPTKLFVVVVEETAQLAANRGQMFGDPSLTALMKAKGHQWRIVDKDVAGADGQPPADVKGYLARAAGKTYPQVFLVTPDGRLMYQGDLPASAAQMQALLMKAGG